MQRFEGRIRRGACVKGARVRCAFANQPPCALEEQQALTCLRYALVQRDVLDVSDAVSLPGAVANSVRESARRRVGWPREARGEGRPSHAVEQALDPRTRLVREAARRRATWMTLRRSTAAQVLFKMLNQGVFSSINGLLLQVLLKRRVASHVAVSVLEHQRWKVLYTCKGGNPHLQLPPPIASSRSRAHLYSEVIPFRGHSVVHVRLLAGRDAASNTLAEKEMRNLARLVTMVLGLLAGARCQLLCTRDPHCG
jgi:hypothetical protein